MKFHINEIKGIWNIVASILHLGNVDFNDKTLDSQNNIPCDFLNPAEIEITASLLSVNIEKLKTALTHKTRKITGKIYKTVMNKVDCQTLRQFSIKINKINYI